MATQLKLPFPEYESIAQRMIRKLHDQTSKEFPAGNVVRTKGIPYISKKVKR